MSAAKKKADDDALPAPPHPLLTKPIPHAYALVSDPKQPGRWFAVHLTGVIAEGLSILEPSDRNEPATYGLHRIHQAMQRRHAEKKWGSE